MWKAKIEHLKKNSQYYPEIYSEVQDRYPSVMSTDIQDIYLSTLVRIKRDGTWYVVHCVEALQQRKYQPVDILRFFSRFILSVHNIIHLYKITGTMEDVDELQIDEEERIIKMYHAYREKSNNTRDRGSSDPDHAIQADMDIEQQAIYGERSISKELPKH